MDPISIISLAGSTTQAAYKISTQLYAFINRVKEADESLLALARELSGLRRSLDAISNILRNPLVRSERATAPENIPIWVAVAGALEDCRKSLEAFEKKVNPHRHEKISHRNVIRKSIAIWKLGLSDADIKTLRDQINTHTNSLQIALQTANVLISSLSPTKATEDVSNAINALTEVVNEVSLRDNEASAPHSTQVQAAARSVVSGAPELVNTGLLQDSDEEVKAASAKILRNVITEYERSLRSHGGNEENIENGAEDESLSDEDALEQALATELCSKGDDLFKDGKYTAAEKHYRDGLRHVAQISKPIEPLDIEGVRLNLATSCFYQGKLEEAELMLLILAQSGAAREQSLQAYHCLGQIYLCLFDFDSALEYTSMALRGRKKAFGKHDPRYISTLRLFELVHEANGDIITARTYAKRLGTDQELENENTMIFELFSGYSQAPHLLMSLREKQKALEQLAETHFLSKANFPQRPLIFMLGVCALDKQEALMSAIEQSHELMVKWLLSQGADPNTGKENTPLAQAGREGHEGIVRLLLDSGANVNSTNKYSEVPALSSAAHRGYQSVVRTLLEYGADVNLTDKDGVTPMLETAAKGHIPTMELLLKNGAKLDDQIPRSHSTLLLMALKNRQPDAAKWLIVRGVNLEAYDWNNQNALMLAKKSSYTSIVELLLEHGAKPEGIPNNRHKNAVYCNFHTCGGAAE